MNTIKCQSINSFADLSLISDHVYVLSFKASTVLDKFITEPDKWLSPQEIKVLAKRKGLQRANFLASRYCIKQLIAQYSCCDLLNINLYFDEPSLKVKACVRSKKMPFSISISHKNNRLLIAFSLTQNTIAVDLENLTKQRDFLSIANHAFSQSECHSLEQATDLCFSFYKLWTLKECMVKAESESLAKVLSLDIESELAYKKLNYCTYVENGYISTLIYPQHLDFKKIHRVQF